MKWLMAIPVWSTPRDSLNRFNLVFSRCPYEESPLGVFFYVMLYHCRFLNPRLKNAMCKSEFFVLFYFSQTFLMGAFKSC